MRASTRKMFHRSGDARYEALFRRHSAVGLLIDPASGRIHDANIAAEAFYGYERDALRRMNISDINMLPAADIAAALAEAREASRTYFLFPHRTGAGDIRYVDVYSGPIELDGRTLLYSIVHDATERREIENALVKSESLLRGVMDNADEGIYVCSFDGRFVDVNAAACRSTGYTRDELLGLTLTDIDRKFDLPTAQTLWKSMLESGPVRVETIHQRRDGSTYPVEVSISSIDAGENHLFFGVARDITDRKRETERIEHLATHDLLTDLPNRVLFHDRLLVAIEAARRGGTHVAVLYLDLDGFKVVNDTFGHEAGDRVLREVAARLRACVRAADTVARIGGDEFAILLTGLTLLDQAARVGHEVVAALGREFEDSTGAAKIGVSVGISLYPHDADRPDSLMHLADQAMYRVKRSGKNAVSFARNTTL